MNSKEMKIPVGFIVPPSGAIGGPPASEEWFAEKKKTIMSKLSETYPEITFAAYDIRTPTDAERFLEEGGEGYLLIVLNSIAGLVRPILYSRKPVVIIAETYGGAGEYLMEYSRALEAGMPIVGIVARDLTHGDVLKRVKLLEVVYRLRHSKILFIVSPSEKYLVELEYPLSIDLYSSIKSVQAITGIAPIILNVQEFAEKYYKKVEENEAKVIAEKWINDAEKNLEKNTEEIIKSAKLYVALKRAAFDYKADAVAVDCIVLRSTGLLDAWPCLAYVELWNDGIVPICEADAYSGAVLLMMKYLADRPGFISDPSPDDSVNEVVYYHCMAPLLPHGTKGRRCPYIITSAHLGTKSASVHVKLPTDETITVVGFSPEERTLAVHTAQAIRNEFSPHACAVKLVGRTKTKTLAKNWKYRAGWHRVVFYGDWREELKELSTLLGLKFIEEDKEVIGI
jgi:hypothetical protein